MPRLSLAEVRARLKEQEEKKGSGKGYTGDNAVFPFWNMPEDTTTTIRFLPDDNQKNEWFWVKREMIHLPFTGIKGGDETKQLTIQVPCMHMYGKSDRIIDECKPWWKDEDPEMKKAAQLYYKKVQYIYQGLVVDSSLKEETLPENPVRRFVLGASLHKRVQAILTDPDIEEWPTDYKYGLDFRIKKTINGKFANYDDSSFARRTRALTDEEKDIIDQHGLFNLSDFLPKEPDSATQDLIYEMFEDSFNGLPFDAEKYKQFYRGGNSNSESGDEGTSSKRSSSTLAANRTAKVVDEEDEEPVVQTRKPVQQREEDEVEQDTAERPAKKDAQAVLAALQARRKKD